MNCSFSREEKKKRLKKEEKQNYNKAGARGPYADFLSSRLCDSKGKKLLPLLFCYSFITCACGKKAGWYWNDILPQLPECLVMASKTGFTQQKALSALLTCTILRALVQPVGNLGSNSSSAVGRNVSLFHFYGKKELNCQTAGYFEMENFSVSSVSSFSLHMSCLNVLRVRTKIAI